MFESCKNHLSCIFSNPKIMKLIHGCDSDIKILSSYLNIQIINFIDTRKLAMAFDPTIKSIGLANLSEKILNLKIDKSLQCAPWNIRPLPNVMRRYACIDSLLLFPIFAYYLLNKSKSYKYKFTKRYFRQ